MALKCIVIKDTVNDKNLKNQYIYKENSQRKSAENNIQLKVIYSR